jgi:hypothetical protein
MNPCCICGTQNRAQIAGFLNGFSDDDQGMLGELEICQLTAALRSDDQEPLRTLPIGHLLEDRLGAGIELGPPFPALPDNLRLIQILQVELFAIKEHFGLVSIVQGSLALAIPLHQHLPGLITMRPLAKLDHMLHLRIR